MKETLQNPKKAAAYLNAILQNDIKSFSLALRDIIDANGGISMFAKKTKLNQESLDRALSLEGSLTIKYAILILNVLGFELQIKEAV